MLATNILIVLDSTMKIKDLTENDYVTIAESEFLKGRPYAIAFDAVVDAGCPAEEAQKFCDRAMRKYIKLRDVDKEIEREMIARQLERIADKQVSGIEVTKVSRNGDVNHVTEYNLKGATTTLKTLIELKGLSKEKEDENLAIKEAAGASQWLSDFYDKQSKDSE